MRYFKDPIDPQIKEFYNADIKDKLLKPHLKDEEKVHVLDGKNRSIETNNLRCRETNGVLMLSYREAYDTWRPICQLIDGKNWISNGNIIYLNTIVPALALSIAKAQDSFILIKTLPPDIVRLTLYYEEDYKTSLQALIWEAYGKLQTKRFDDAKGNLSEKTKIIEESKAYKPKLQESCEQIIRKYNAHADAENKLNRQFKEIFEQE